MLSGFEIFPTIVGPGYLAHFPHWHIPNIFFFKMIIWHIPTHLEKVAREICTLVPRGGWIAFLRDYWHIFLFKNMRPPSQRLLSKKRLKWPLFSVCQIELKQKSSIKKNIEINFLSQKSVGKKLKKKWREIEEKKWPDCSPPPWAKEASSGSLHLRRFLRFLSLVAGILYYPVFPCLDFCVAWILCFLNFCVSSHSCLSRRLPTTGWGRFSPNPPPHPRPPISRAQSLTWKPTYLKDSYLCCICILIGFYICIYVCASLCLWLFSSHSFWNPTT